jgi:hypothetical protein
MSVQRNSTEDEILKTLRSINQSAAETDKISSATAEVINAQGGQIDNIARNVDKIDENLNTSEWLIRGLKGWGGRLANAFSSGPQKSDSSIASKYPSYMPSEAVDLAKNEKTKQTASIESQKALDPPRSEFDTEVDRQLDQISNVLGGIHAKSLAISDSISRQVKTVEAVDQSLARSGDRIKKQHNDIKGLR